MYATKSSTLKQLPLHMQTLWAALEILRVDRSTEAGKLSSSRVARWGNGALLPQQPCVPNLSVQALLAFSKFGPLRNSYQWKCVSKS